MAKFEIILLGYLSKNGHLAKVLTLLKAFEDCNLDPDMQNL